MSCSDGVRNGNEDGVDCGGPNCPACAAFQSNFVIVAVGGSTGGLFVVLLVTVVIRHAGRRKAARVAVDKPLAGPVKGRGHMHRTSVASMTTVRVGGRLSLTDRELVDYPRRSSAVQPEPEQRPDNLVIDWDRFAQHKSRRNSHGIY